MGGDRLASECTTVGRLPVGLPLWRRMPGAGSGGGHRSGGPVGCALILPRCDAAAMSLFLDELSGHVAPGAHAILVLDGAGWHTAKDLRWPEQVTPLPLPAYSPELNPQERVWELLRQHQLALRRFLEHTALLARSLPGRLAPLRRRGRAHPLRLLLSLGHRLVNSWKAYKAAPPSPPRSRRA